MVQSSDKVQMNGSFKKELTINNGHLSDDENYESILLLVLTASANMFCVIYIIIILILWQKI